METYRRGRNGTHSKCVCRETGTWVRIPSSPPEIFRIKIYTIFFIWGGMKKRSLFEMFLLTAIFKGFYLLYWIASTQNSLELETKGSFSFKTNQNHISGGLTIVLIIFTFGLYYLYWQWNTCKILSKKGAPDNSLITLILSILIIGIILNPFIIQSSINNLITSDFSNHRFKY